MIIDIKTKSKYEIIAEFFCYCKRNARIIRWHIFEEKNGRKGVHKWIYEHDHTERYYKRNY